MDVLAKLIWKGIHLVQREYREKHRIVSLAKVPAQAAPSKELVEWFESKSAGEQMDLIKSYKKMLEK